MHALRRLRQHPTAAFGVGLLVLFSLAALFAPLLAHANPAFIDLSHRLQPPSAQHWFGTDELGRDVFARTLFGARVSLLVAVAVVTLSLAAGLVLGAVAGFYGGVADTAINLYLSNAFLALPGILLAVAFVAFLGPSLVNLVLALALSGWVNYARLVRAQVMSLRDREFVQAARSLGASDLRLLFRHIVPNCIAGSIVFSMSDVVLTTLAGSALSYLGLGVQPPTAEWGVMIKEGQNFIATAWWITTFPGIAIVLLTLGFSLLADGLAERFGLRQS